MQSKLVLIMRLPHQSVARNAGSAVLLKARLESLLHIEIAFLNIWCRKEKKLPHDNV